MSRSHRRTPISGITTAESDKWFKRMENRRARRLPVTEVPHAKAFGNPWKSDKDGKYWFDRERFPELMRK